jgi:hypothetical protein
MSFARLISIALVLAIAVPVSASAQDRRSPDAADPMRMFVQRDRTAPAPPPVAQDLRSPDARDGFVAPAPSAPPDAFPWLEAGVLGVLALALIGLMLVTVLRRRVAARA